VKTETVRYWRRIFAGNLIASALVVVAFGGVTWRTPMSSIAQSYLIATLFSMCIGPLVGVAMPRFSPWVWRRTRFPFNWLAVTGAMIAMAIAGSVVAISILALVGQIPWHDFSNWLAGSLRVAVVVTLTVGLFITFNEVSRARTAQANAQAQLASLESRVQPHFLFNTLNSIAALIYEDPRGAERMIGQLASLMRSSLDQQGAALVSLEDELKVVKDYLAIEQVRFGERLRFHVDVDETTRNARVPRMSVQTLVENSVKYAVSPRREGAVMRISAVREPRGTRITVADDGPGLNAAELPEGHGLALLRERARLLYGDQQWLAIHSGPDGTQVTLRVPDTHDVPAARASCP